LAESSDKDEAVAERTESVRNDEGVPAVEAKEVPIALDLRLEGVTCDVVDVALDAVDDNVPEVEDDR
jgi:hypothetical protein